MFAKITDELEYKEFLYLVFTNCNVLELQRLNDEINNSLYKIKDYNTFVRLSRLHKLINSYIEILNEDLSKQN